MKDGTEKLIDDRTLKENREIDEHGNVFGPPMKLESIPDKIYRVGPGGNIYVSKDPNVKTELPREVKITL